MNYSKELMKIAGIFDFTLSREEEEMCFGLEEDLVKSTKPLLTKAKKFYTKESYDELATCIEEAKKQFVNIIAKQMEKSKQKE